MGDDGHENGDAANGWAADPISECLEGLDLIETIYNQSATTEPKPSFPQPNPLLTPPPPAASSHGL